MLPTQDIIGYMAHVGIEKHIYCSGHSYYNEEITKRASKGFIESLHMNDYEK